jgi:RNA polymerase sigma-70 factor (ECF subfamily)
VSSVAPDQGAASPGPGEVISFEEGLVRRAQRGDREALRQLLAKHAEALYARVILPRLGDPSTAEDLLKATMVTAIEKLSTFHWQGRSIYFWLRQIAVNRIIDHHRRNQRAQRLAQSLAREPEPEPEGLGRSGAETELIAREERRINGERVRAALAKLNPRYRRAIELRLLQELPRQQCALQLEVTLGTFDVLLFRAVNAFRRSFGDP